MKKRTKKTPLHLRKYLSPISVILSALLLIVLGVFFILSDQLILLTVRYTLGIVLVSYGILSSVNAIVKRIAIKLSFVLLNVIVVISGAAVFFIPTVLISVATNFASLWLALSGTANLIALNIHIRNNLSGKASLVVQMIISYVFSVLLFLMPVSDRLPFGFIIGIYIILLGLTNLLDFIRLITKKTLVNRIKRRHRVPVPALFNAFFPVQSARSLKRLLNKNPDLAVSDFNINRTGEVPDLEIFIHVGRSTAVLGHIDIFYRDVMISYGSYDEQTQRLSASLGDGVMSKTIGKEKYIKFTLSGVKYMLFSYGIKLTDEQKQTIDSIISEVEQDAYRWYCLEERRDSSKKDEVYTDYASKLRRACNTQFYKFSSGKFKSYFVIDMNCVMLVDKILGVPGIGVVPSGHLITPGHYYDFLNRELLFEDSNVISRTLYIEDQFLESEITEKQSNH